MAMSNFFVGKLAIVLLLLSLGWCFIAPAYKPVRACGAKASSTDGLSSVITPPPADLGARINRWFQQLIMGKEGTPEPSASPPPEEPKLIRRTGGPVSLVLGATGRAGQQIVLALLAAGHDVIGAARNESKLYELYGEEVLTASQPKHGQGLLDYVSPVDVTQPNSLTPSLFQDVDHVILALGPTSREPGLDSEAVDYKGVQNVIEAFKGFKTSERSKARQENLFSFRTSEDLKQWQRLDDVIMGGRSSSTLKLNEDEGYVEYKGDLVVEDGGFCGQRAQAVNNSILFDLSNFDGIRLRVYGDGNRYKMNLKTADPERTQSESTYQASLDTVAGQWVDVDLPFDRFFPVVRNRVDYKAPRLSPSSNILVTAVALVYSRFGYNKDSNPHFTPGSFSLKITDISAYLSERPAVILLSSAGTERNAKVDGEEERKKEIPIVQLNPSGILNYKYKGEAHLRQSGAPYTILRACGLVPEQTFSNSYRLQAAQGDLIVGRLTRKDLGQAVVGALNSPYAAGKTLELRRDENADAKDKITDFNALFRPLIQDIDRPVTSGLLPFPEPADWAGDVSPERRQEILDDPRVQASVQRDRDVATQKREHKSDRNQSPNRPGVSEPPPVAATAVAER